MRTLAATAASAAAQGGAESPTTPASPAPLSAAGPAFVAFVATPPSETAQSRSFAAAAAAVAELPPRCRQVLVYARLWCVQYLPHVLRKTNRVGYGLLDISVAKGASARSPRFRFGGGDGASPAESLKADPRVPLARRMVRVLAAVIFPKTVAAPPASAARRAFPRQGRSQPDVRVQPPRGAWAGMGAATGEP